MTANAIIEYLDVCKDIQSGLSPSGILLMKDQWTWIKSVLVNPELLAEGLKQYQDQQAQTTVPLQERLKIVDDLLVENQTQLQRLLDLYLKGGFPQEMLTERKNRLETTIKTLKEERAKLSELLEAKMLTKEQVRTIKDFAEKVQEGLTAADNNFESRRELIEMLDVQVRLTIENTKKVAYVQCRFGEKRLLIMSLATYEKFWYNGLKLIPLFILVNFCTRDSDIGLSFGRFVEHSGWLTWRLAFQV